MNQISEKRNSLFSDGLLGLFDGVDSALWGYGFATILFAGALTPILPLGVTLILLGWGLVGLFVALTSASRVHIANVDEQGVVILASAGTLLAAQLGPDITGPTGISTMLAMIALASLLVAASFVFVGHLRLARLLELLPFPVICGFMAGVGWLLLDAAVFVTVDSPINASLPAHLAEAGQTAKLLATLACGALMVLFMTRVRRAWAFPAVAMVIFCGFYATVAMLGIEESRLIEEGWLFNLPRDGIPALDLLAMVSPAAVDTGFLYSVLPELLTIVFLALLSVSMSLTALSTSGSSELENSREIRSQGFGNVLCAATACPPSYTDVASTMLYREFGARTRLMPVVSALTCLAVALSGGWLISFIPKVLVGATIFLFAYRMMVEWLFERVRGFQPVDFLIVCIILGVVIFVGFMVGILTGIVLTVILFVLRYSMISAIHGRYSLREYRSSVERPPAINAILDQHGVSSLVYTLRGFLFFGTANAVLERIKADLDETDEAHLSILLDFKRVTGMDISALNTFLQIKRHCDLEGVRLLYSDVPMDIQMQLKSLGAVTEEDGSPLFFDELDYAVENMEECVLGEFAPDVTVMTIREHLGQILDRDDRIELVMHALERVECKAGEALFLQGDRDDGFYILEAGALSAFIGAHGNEAHRVKKFGPGSLIGELSMFMPTRQRTATVVADVDSVLFFLSTELLDSEDLVDSRISGAVHELIARALGTRINYMNQRLMLELD
jgi:SulP family sulfate permease